jgi:hypothetical protein
MKRKYNVKLQELPRPHHADQGVRHRHQEHGPHLRGNTAQGFHAGEHGVLLLAARQAVSIVVFCGGLRLQECQALVLEKMIRMSDGYKITHSRVKQCSDQPESVFLVPAHGGFADRLGMYLGKVNSNLNKFTSRVWWTVTKRDMLHQQACHHAHGPNAGLI